MAIYPIYRVEAKLDGSNWTDITNDIISPITFSYGLDGALPIDRVAGIGRMTFTLNSSSTCSGGVAGYYIPTSSKCRVGFGIGLPVRLVLYYGVEKTKFYGEIPADGIEVITGNLVTQQVKVKVYDWMYQASIHELQTPSFAQNKNITEIVALILANMDKQPLATDYRTGYQTFASVFDTIKSETRALAEFSKVAISEYGYIYITRKNDEEELKVEGRYSRSIEKPTVDTILEYSEDLLITEDGDYIMTEDGDYLSIFTATNQDAIFDNSFYDVKVNYGAITFNRIKTSAYPRIIDDDATTVLFSLNYPIELQAGTTVIFTGRYRDQTGTYTKVAGIDMRVPIATTDYLLNSASDGTGTDLTADLSVTAVFGTADVIFTVENTGASDGFVTKCNAVGRGIYTPDDVDYVAEDSTSIAALGPIELKLDMKYQDDPTVSKDIADAILSQVKLSKLEPEEAGFIANRNDFLTSAFIQLEVGDRIRLIEDISEIYSDYFIQGISATINVGGVIKYSYLLKQSGYDIYTYSIWDTDLWDTGIWSF